MLKDPACGNNLSYDCSLLEDDGTNPPGNLFNIMFNIWLNDEHTLIKLTDHVKLGEAVSTL